jgi:hypothetical protein
MRPQMASMQRANRFAQSLGKKKVFRISSLHDCDSVVTGVLAVAAIRHAIVEFPAGAAVGIADG